MHKNFVIARGATRTHLWNGRSRPTMMLSTHMAIFFQLSIKTSSIVPLGVGSRMRQTKRASFAQKFRHCVVATKTHPRGGQQADHDAVHTYGHFLSAINTNLIYSAFGSRITHEPNEKRIICTRISSSCEGHKVSLMCRCTSRAPHFGDMWYGWYSTDCTQWNFVWGVAVVWVEFCVGEVLENATQSSTLSGIDTSN